MSERTTSAAARGALVNGPPYRKSMLNSWKMSASQKRTGSRAGGRSTGPPVITDTKLIVEAVARRVAARVRTVPRLTKYPVSSPTPSNWVPR
jgi:hypothetical protein